MDIQGTCVISSGFISWSFRCLLGVRLKTMAKFATKLTIPKWISPLESLSRTSHPADLVCSVKNPGAAALGRKGLLFSSTSNTIIQEIVPERCTIFIFIYALRACFLSIFWNFFFKVTSVERWCQTNCGLGFGELLWCSRKGRYK